MDKLKIFLMNHCCIKITLLAFTLLSACSNGIQTEISPEMHEQLYGVWTPKGFKNVLQSKISPRNIEEYYDDTICCYIVDPMYCTIDSAKQYYTYGTRCPSFGEPQTTDSFTVIPISWEYDIDKDSLTDEERYAKNTLWIIEEPLDASLYHKSHPYCLYYQGSGLFLSDTLPNKNYRKFAKMESDGSMQYGICDEHGNHKDCVTIEKQFSCQWYFERSQEFGLNDKSGVLRERLDSFFRDAAFGNILSLELHEKNENRDSIICTFSKDDVLNSCGLEIYGLNTRALVYMLEPRFRTPKPEEFKTYSYDLDLIWKNDTAYIHNEFLEGEFFFYNKTL